MCASSAPSELIEQGAGDGASAAKIDAANTTVLYTLNNATLIQIGTNITLTAPFETEARRLARVGGINLQALTATTDYVGNSAADGSGVDLTSSLSASIVASSANTATLSVTNNGTQQAYITKLQVRGQGIYDYNTTVLSAENMASQQNLGQRVVNINMAYQADPVVANEAAQYVLNVWSDPLSYITKLTILGNWSDALMQAVLFRDISDCIALDETVTRLSHTTKYFINAVTIDITQGRAIRATYTLAPADQNSYWILEVVGSSELDQTTRPGYGVIVGHIDVAHTDSPVTRRTLIRRIRMHTPTPPMRTRRTPTPAITTSHVDSVHVDSHVDTAHTDTAHTDVVHQDSHSDVAHVDTHGDTAFVDVHDDTPHNDAAHTDHTDHVDSNSGVHHDRTTHDDISHADDAHTDSHDDTAHDDEHNDTAHSDAHSDTAHSDVAHADSAHVDTHGDVNHSDTAHADDSTHSDAVHADRRTWIRIRTLATLTRHTATRTRTRHTAMRIETASRCHRCGRPSLVGSPCDCRAFWDTDKHPRGEHGRWGSGTASAGAPPSQTSAQVTTRGPVTAQAKATLANAIALLPESVRKRIRRCVSWRTLTPSVRQGCAGRSRRRKVRRSRAMMPSASWRIRMCF